MNKDPSENGIILLVVSYDRLSPTALRHIFHNNYILLKCYGQMKIDSKGELNTYKRIKYLCRANIIYHNQVRK